jgi:GNAT superfamily N-acetyltransferase
VTIVRPLVKADATTLARLHAASWRNAYRGLLRDEYLDSIADADRLAVWAARMDHPQPTDFGFIAEADAACAGFVFLRGVDDAAWGTLVDNLHVLPAFKGQGIGRLLMEAAARETIRRHPDHGVFLWVFEANHHARRFYARLGGRDAERQVVDAPGGGALPAWRVVWPSPAHLLASMPQV